MDYQNEVKLALKELSDASVAYQRYRDYHLGEQDLVYATDRARSRFGDMFNQFRENLCEPVVAASASRLRLQSLTIVAQKAQTQELADRLARSKFDRLQRRVHEDALICGESFLVAWEGGDGVPRLSYNRGGLIMPVYDPGSDDEMLFAVKAWRMGGKAAGEQVKTTRVRVTVYYPDRAERWVGENAIGSAIDPASLAPYAEDGSPAVQPHNFGRVPVVHFDAGRSDLANAIPIQDALNKSGYDILVSGEFNSLPQRWATGIDLPNDPLTGRAVAAFEPKSIWTAANADARFGQLLPADMDSLLRTGDTWRQAMARVTRTPLHYLVPSGGFPSGEALKVAEAPFKAKLDGLESTFGESWERAGALLMMMLDDGPVEAVWAKTSPLAEPEALSNALAKKTLGVGLAQNLRELGYSEDEISLILEERDADTDRAVRAMNRAPANPVA